MRRALLAIFVLLVFSGVAVAEDSYVIRRTIPVSTGCNMGYQSVGGSSGSLPASGERIILYTAGCSGTLSTAKAYHNTTDTDRAKICIYLDDGDNTPDAGDTKVACSDVITSNTSGAWATASFSSGGSITSGSKYWIVYSTDSTTWATYYTGSGSTGYYNAANFYTNEPADMGTGWTSSARTYSAYVVIQ